MEITKNKKWVFLPSALFVPIQKQKKIQFLFVKIVTLACTCCVTESTSLSKIQLFHGGVRLAILVSTTPFVIFVYKEMEPLKKPLVDNGYTWFVLCLPKVSVLWTKLAWSQWIFQKFLPTNVATNAFFVYKFLVSAAIVHIQIVKMDFTWHALKNATH